MCAINIPGICKISGALSVCLEDEIGLILMSRDVLVILLARLRWRRAFSTRRKTSARQISIIDAAVSTVPDPNVASATDTQRS